MSLCQHRRVCWTAESWIHDKQCGFILVLSIAPILFVFEDVWLCAVRVVLGVQWPVVTGHSCTNSQRGWSIMVVISGIRAAGRSGAPSVNDEQKDLKGLLSVSYQLQFQWGKHFLDRESEDGHHKWSVIHPFSSSHSPIRVIVRLEPI